MRRAREGARERGARGLGGQVKRGTLQHPKTRRLARLLNVRPAEALGLVQGLLDWAYYHAICGDVGKWDDEEIADGAGCQCADGASFVAALVKSGWLDEHPEHRLIIHDLVDHADDTWRKTLGRRRLQFVARAQPNGQCPDSEVHDGTKSPGQCPDNVRDVRPNHIEPNHAEPGEWRGAPHAPAAPRTTAEQVGAEHGIALLPFHCPVDLEPTPGMLELLRREGCEHPDADARLFVAHYATSQRREIDWTETGPRFARWVARHNQIGCAVRQRPGRSGAAGRQDVTVDAVKAAIARREAQGA